jgi:Ni/Co efflux regulator RcnB
MKRLQMFLIAAALMTGGSALASAQPMDHDGGRGDRFHDRDRDDRRFRDRDDRRFRDRDDRRFRDRDDRRFVDRDDHRYFVGERRFFNGYYWTWDGGRWCRRDGRAVFYFNF